MSPLTSQLKAVNFYIVEKKEKRTRLAFHWSYILLPLIILIMSIVLTIFFYGRLPIEVAYRFKPDGAPASWLSRKAIVLWMLLPQLFLTVLAGAGTWGILWLSILFRQEVKPRVNLGKVLLLMGNMVAIPQLVLFFAMLDILSYNLYRIHLLPLWVFAIIIMGLGIIVLGIFFVRALRANPTASKE